MNLCTLPEGQVCTAPDTVGGLDPADALRFVEAVEEALRGRYGAPEAWPLYLRTVASPEALRGAARAFYKQAEELTMLLAAEGVKGAHWAGWCNGEDLILEE